MWIWLRTGIRYKRKRIKTKVILIPGWRDRPKVRRKFDKRIDSKEIQIQKTTCQRTVISKEIIIEKDRRNSSNS